MEESPQAVNCHFLLTVARMGDQLRNLRPFAVTVVMDHAHNLDSKDKQHRAHCYLFRFLHTAAKSEDAFAEPDAQLSLRHPGLSPPWYQQGGSQALV